MKKNLSKIAIFASIALVFSSCDAQKNTTAKKSSAKSPVVSQKYSAKDVVYFSEGENRFLSDYQMNVTYNKLTSDSRCPQGTNCIWAGAATVNLTLMGTATRPFQVDLSTLDAPGKNLVKSTNFNGYKITLVEVTPKSAKGNTIGLKFEKSDEVPAGTTSRVTPADR